MEKKLQRNERDKMIAGVCAGLADYFDIDVTWIRIAFVVAVLAGFSGLLIYIILWIALPSGPYNPKFNPYDTDYKVYEDKTSTMSTDPNQPVNPVLPPSKPRNNNGRVIVGLLLIAFGGFFLLEEFNILPYWFNLSKLWPLVFIIPGILMIAKAGKKEPWKEKWQDKQNWDNSSEEKKTDTDQPAI